MTKCLIIAATLLAAGATQGQMPGEPRTDLPVGSAQHVVIDGRTMYMAGGVRQLSEATGSLVIVDTATGEPIPPHAHVEGEIEAIVDDGAGGWFVAGDLIKVGPLEHAPLARIGADGELIEFPIALAGGEVYRLERLDNALIIVGNFTTVNGLARSGIAAVDIETGETLPWNPRPDFGVAAMKVVDDTLYLVGDFTFIAGEAREGAASFTGPELELTPWAPSLPRGVRAFEIAGSQAFLGGRFSRSGGPPRAEVFAIYLSTGEPTELQVEGFASDDRVAALHASGDTLYIAGRFKQVRGAGRTGLAAVDAITGELLPFAPALTLEGVNDPIIRSMVMADEGLVFGGDFSTVNGEERRRIAMVDPVTGATRSWDPRVSVNVSFLGGLNQVTGAGVGRIAIAGEFALAGGLLRDHVAAIDLDTAEVLEWTVDLEKRTRDTSLSITGMIVAEDRVYLSGTFEKADGFIVNGLAAFSREDGSLDISFDHAITPTALVFGFSDIARVPGVIAARFGYTLYGLDEATGTPIWSIENINFPGKLAADPEHGRFYIPGRIEQASPPEVREHIAEIDAATGKFTEWNPRPDDRVRTVAFWKDKLILGGAFRAIGGEIRPKVAVFERDPAARALAPAPLWEFALGASDRVDAITVAGDLMLMEGALSRIRGIPVNDLVALSLPVIEPLDWSPPWLTAKALTKREAVLSSNRWYYGDTFLPYLAVLPIDVACRADLNGDGVLDFFDFLLFQSLFTAGDLRADFTGDGILDFFDFLAFQTEFAAGCP